MEKIYPNELVVDQSEYPSKSDFEVVKGEGNVGRGVISKKEFQPGDLVARITGKYSPIPLQHTLQTGPSDHLYDPWFSGLFLHSCDPNISVDMEMLTVTALKPIKNGDYILMDYQETEEVLFKEFNCECGSSKCRGWITGKVPRSAYDEQS